MIGSMMTNMNGNNYRNGDKNEGNKRLTGTPACVERLLVVDDDSDVLFTLTTVLRDAGFIVDSYSNPTKALMDYKPETYDLLILDVKMPEINGFDLYRKIKAVDQRARVCFLTAGETYFSEFARIFPELNETNYMLKPVENKQLLKRVLAIIGSKDGQI